MTTLHEELDDTPLPLTVSEERRAKDLELYHTWNKTKSKQDLGVLVNHLAPLMYKEVSRVSGTLPTSVLNAEAKKWTIKAIQTFEPEKGYALSTHVMNWLPKVRRLNYKYQNAVRLPENQHLQYREYSKAIAELSDELNAEPTEDEIAARLGWSKGQVVKYKSRLYADLLEGASEHAAEFTTYSDSSILMKHLMEQLTSEEKMILELNKTISSQELATKLGVNTNRLNYLKRKLEDKIRKLQSEIGLR